MIWTSPNFYAILVIFGMGVGFTTHILKTDDGSVNPWPYILFAWALNLAMIGVNIPFLIKHLSGS